MGFCDTRKEYGDGERGRKDERRAAGEEGEGQRMRRGVPHKLGHTFQHDRIFVLDHLLPV